MKLNLIKKEIFKNVQTTGLSGIMIALSPERINVNVYHKCIEITVEYHRLIPDLSDFVPHTITYDTGFFDRLN